MCTLNQLLSMDVAHAGVLPLSSLQQYLRMRNGVAHPLMDRLAASASVVAPVRIACTVEPIEFTDSTVSPAVDSNVYVAVFSRRRDPPTLMITNLSYHLSITVSCTLNTRIQHPATYQGFCLPVDGCLINEYIMRIFHLRTVLEGSLVQR